MVSFFCCRKLYFHMIQGLGEVSRGLKELPHGCRERLSHKPRHRGDAPEAAGLQSFLVMLEGEPFEEMLAQPSLGAGLAAEVSQGVACLLDGFTSSSGKSQRWGSMRPEPRHTNPQGSGLGSSPEPGRLSWCPGCDPGHLGFDPAAALVLLPGMLSVHFSSHFSLASSWEKWPTPSRATSSWWK